MKKQRKCETINKLIFLDKYRMFSMIIDPQRFFQRRPTWIREMSACVRDISKFCLFWY